jgi:hypothetical protein
MASCLDEKSGVVAFGRRNAGGCAEEGEREHQTSTGPAPRRSCLVMEGF